MIDVANPAPDTQQTLIPWMTLEVGGVAADDHIDQIEADRSLSVWAKDIMRRPALYSPGEPRMLNLARCRVRDLGFGEPPFTTHLLTRVEFLGGLCPPPVGPHARKAFAEQPVGALLYIAMAPISITPDLPGIFFLERFEDGRCWLGTDHARRDRQWDLDIEIALVVK